MNLLLSNREKYIGKGNNVGSPRSTALQKKLKNEQNSEDIVIGDRNSHEGSSKESGLIWGLKKNVGREGRTLQVGAAHEQGMEENKQDGPKGQKEG